MRSSCWRAAALSYRCQSCGCWKRCLDCFIANGMLDVRRRLNKLSVLISEVRPSFYTRKEQFSCNKNTKGPTGRVVWRASYFLLDRRRTILTSRIYMAAWLNELGLKSSQKSTLGEIYVDYFLLPSFEGTITKIPQNAVNWWWTLGNDPKGSPYHWPNS